MLNSAHKQSNQITEDTSKGLDLRDDLDREICRFQFDCTSQNLTTMVFDFTHTQMDVLDMWKFVQVSLF